MGRYMDPRPDGALAGEAALRRVRVSTWCTRYQARVFFLCFCTVVNREPLMAAKIVRNCLAGLALMFGY